MDQAVSLWDFTSGRLLRRLPLKGEKRYVRNLGFSADGKTLVASQSRGFLQFWDVATGKEQRTLQLTEPGRPNPDLVFFQFHVSADGKRVSTLEHIAGPKESTRLAVWDTATGRLVSQQLLAAREAHVCAWLADGAAVALPLADGLTLMQVEGGAVRFRIPGTSAGGPLAASPDDRLLAAPMPAGVVGIWETATGKKVAMVVTGPVSYLALTANNRQLITVHEDRLRVWDLATGKERRRWSLPVSASGAAPYPWESPRPTRLLLSGDGQRAFTALADGTALVWDLTPSRRRGSRPAKPDPSQLAAWWADLAAEDAGRAYAAIWRLTEVPEATVPFLRRRPRPPPDAEIKEIYRGVADLDSPRFSTREKAFARLLHLGEVAEPVLRHALEKNPSLEVRHRIQRVLSRWSQRPLSGESLRTLRALQVLEDAGPEGTRLLRELAGGVVEARLTHEARASLNRLARRSP